MRRVLIIGSLFALVFTGVQTCALPSDYEGFSSWFTGSSDHDVKEVTLGDRSYCQPGDIQPAIRLNTTERVVRLRREMINHNLDAYVVPSEDEHQNEDVAPPARRREHISGLSGSAGTAVVLANQQALWTDGRYFLQADAELDCNWLLMKENTAGVPSLLEWLKQTLPSGAKVGADPRLIGADTWLSYLQELNKSGIVLVAEEQNLVDLIWTSAEGRPEYSKDPIFIHDLKFTGKAWQDKVADVRARMVLENADLLVLSGLDEIAWLLNLRGNDIPYTPFFRAYMILGKNFLNLYTDLTKITAEVETHLSVNQCTTTCVSLFEYDVILEALGNFSQTAEVQIVMLGSKYAYSGGSSYALYGMVPAEKRLLAVSPVLGMKARKNQVEINSMRNAHIMDSVALIDFLAFMEKEITAGNNWTEISAATRLEEYRAQQEFAMGISFTTISAMGPNGAIIHYSPVPETDVKITNQSLYLVDSGGQYLDGTTDVTRTMHYGTPTTFHREMYTRVLKGAVDMASLIFPEGTDDSDIDILARRPLYDVGLDFRHGTGHGVGMFLSIHESPIQVRIYSTEPHKLEVGHFLSDEPGYYQDGDFGVRLETILMVVAKNTSYNFDKQMLGFEPVTLVPFEPNLIDLSLLSVTQCEWVNWYNAHVRATIGPVLVAQGRTEGQAWMTSKTAPLDCNKASAL